MLETAERIPSASNGFLIKVKENNKSEGKVQQYIDLTLNMCEWMFQNSFTSEKLELKLFNSE